MGVDIEGRMAEFRSFSDGGILVPKLPKPPAKPLDVDVARAATNNLIVNVVNRQREIRKIVVAQGIQFHNQDVSNEFKIDPTFDNPDEVTIPKSLQNDFPDIVIRDDNHAVFISDVQRVEFQIEVVNTKDKFKTALETPGIHVIYTGHSRYGRGPCFGPDLTLGTPGGGVVGGTIPADLTGENWETGTDRATTGIFRMGHPFVGVPFEEMDQHKYKTRPVPATVTVSPIDMDPLTVKGSLKPIDLRGTRFEPFIIDPVVERYWGCRTAHGDGVLLFAGFQNTASTPLDLGGINLQCRCLTVLSCESFNSFHEIVRSRKGFKRTETEGFAYFVKGLYFHLVDRLYVGSLFEFNKQNDFKPWFEALEFAVSRTNTKLSAARAGFTII